jgi:hypothetical protein
VSGPYKANAIRSEMLNQLEKWSFRVGKVDWISTPVTLPANRGTAGPLGLSSTYYNEAIIPGGSPEAGPHMGPQQPRTSATDPGGSYLWPDGTPANPCPGVELFERVVYDTIMAQAAYPVLNTGHADANKQFVPAPLG